MLIFSSGGKFWAAINEYRNEEIPQELARYVRELQKRVGALDTIAAMEKKGFWFDLSGDLCCYQMHFYEGSRDPEDGEVREGKAHADSIVGAVALAALAAVGEQP